MRITRSLSALDIWLMITAFSRNSREGGNYIVRVPATGARNLASGALSGGEKPQAGQNDFSAVNGKCFRNLFIATGNTEGKL